MNAVAVTVALWLKRGLALLRGIGPYAAIEMLLPGGTLIALLLWLARQGAFTKIVVAHRPAAAVVCVARRFEVRLVQGFARANDRCEVLVRRVRWALPAIALFGVGVASAADTLSPCKLPGVTRAA